MKTGDSEIKHFKTTTQKTAKESLTNLTSLKTTKLCMTYEGSLYFFWGMLGKFFSSVVLLKKAQIQ